MADRKAAHVLISNFEKRQRQAGRTELINRYSERWTADSLLESMSTSELNEAMDYYFRITKTPTWKSFALNATKLLKAKRDIDNDKKVREIQRAKMKEIMDEFRG